MMQSRRLGLIEGFIDGSDDGFMEGSSLGILEGFTDGSFDGFTCVDY